MFPVLLLARTTVLGDRAERLFQSCFDALMLKFWRLQAEGAFAQFDVQDRRKLPTFMNSKVLPYGKQKNVRANPVAP